MAGFREFNGQTRTSELLGEAFRAGADGVDWGQNLRERLIRESEENCLHREPEYRRRMLDFIELRVWAEAPRQEHVLVVPETAFDTYCDRADVPESSGFDRALKMARDMGDQAQRTLRAVAERRRGKVGIVKQALDADEWTHVGPYHRGAWLILDWSREQPYFVPPTLHIGWIALVSPEIRRAA